MNVDDTIAALATASGAGAISVIRVSGPDSLGIADRVFRCAGEPPSRRPAGSFVVGRVRGTAGWVDEAVLLIFRASRSYTREDVAEFQCHGGRENARRLLRHILEAGARPAEPGEFTRRAFLNGRLDLTQAEAVMDLIGAQSERAAAAAMDQLHGALRDRINGQYEEIVSAAADIEACLDYPEEDFPDTMAAQALAGAERARTGLMALLATWEEGHRLREGALVVISGRPNAGKSTLMNVLLGRDRAIVTPIPGTTRDTLEESWVLNGMPVRLVDTAGLRATDCAIELEGIARAERYIRDADLRLHVMDCRLPVDVEERAAIAMNPPDKCLIVVNKVDLGVHPKCCAPDGYAVIKTALNTGAGVHELRDEMSRLLEIHPERPAHAVIGERHRLLLADAVTELDAGINILISSQYFDSVLAVTHFRAAAESLGKITGKVYYDDMLNSIFSRFCVGK